MADGGGPTERDRSEGTPTQEGPNQEHKPLVTWGFSSNSPKAKQSAPRQTLLILPHPGEYKKAPTLASRGFLLAAFCVDQYFSIFAAASNCLR
jgi:hypothetical protein